MMRKLIWMTQTVTALSSEFLLMHLNLHMFFLSWDSSEKLFVIRLSSLVFEGFSVRPLNVSCVSAVRVNLEAHQLTTERYVSDPSPKDIDTHSWQTHQRAERELELKSRKTRARMMPDRPFTEMNDSNNKTASTCMFEVFPLKILKNVCFPSDVLQSAGGEPGSQG